MDGIKKNKYALAASGKNKKRKYNPKTDWVLAGENGQPIYLYNMINPELNCNG